RIEGQMDASLYVETIDECIPLTQEWYGIDPSKMIFQQDNNPKHASQLAMQFFNDRYCELPIWSSNPPDHNPVKHLWAYPKRQVANYQKPPASMLEHWERVKAEWNKISAFVCQA